MNTDCLYSSQTCSKSLGYTKYKEIRACPLYKILPSFLLQHTYFYPQACFNSMDARGQGKVMAGEGYLGYLLRDSSMKLHTANQAWRWAL